MISAKEYFEHISWQRKESNLRSAPYTYEPFSTMELKTLELEAAAGNPGAVEELGERYLFGLDELPTDPDKALALFQQAAEAGHPDAMHMLAEVHLTVEFGKQDYEQYFPLLQKAAESGSWKSMFNLACAYYKGKAAYDGHGFDADHFTALKWSTQCAVATMGLLEFYFTHPCSDGFSDYMQGVFSLFVQSICVSARQLIKGDGVKQDLQWAKTMLTDAQDFYKHYFKSACSDFTALLGYCEPPADQS